MRTDFSDKSERASRDWNAPGRAERTSGAALSPVPFVGCGLEGAELDHPRRHLHESVDLDTAISGGFDCAVITTDHTAFDYARLAALPLIVDTRNALKGMTGANIVRL